MDANSFKDHPIWSLIAQAKQQLSEYSSQAKISDQFSDAKYKVDFIFWVFDQSEPTLVGKHELDQIVQGQLQAIVNVINQGKNNPAQLANIEQPFANIMKVFPYPRVKRIFRSESNEIVEDFRQQFEQLNQTLNDQLIRLREVILENEASAGVLADRLNDIETNMGEVRSQVSSQLEVWENTNKAEIAERLGEINSEFEESQARRRKEIENQIQKISDELSSIREQSEAVRLQANERMRETTSSLEEWRNSEIEEAEAILGQIRGIYEVVGQTTLAGDFEKAAKEESNSAWWFSLGAIIFFVVAPLFFAFQWWQLDVTQYDFTAMLSKVASSAIFLIPAAYFASTAQRHRRVATALRSLGVRVATFDAYLANFELAERNKLKEKMASVFFNANISPDRIRNASGRELNRNIELFSDAVTNLDELLKSVGKTVSKSD